MLSPHTSYRWRRRESHRANQVYASPHTATGGGEERGAEFIEPLKCMRSPPHQLQVRGGASHRAQFKPYCAPHTLSYRWRGERDHRAIKCMRFTTHPLQVEEEREEFIRANQVYALTTHQLQVEGERVIEPIKCMRSPHTSYRWRGERVIESIKCMRPPHTSSRWRGERVIEPIKLYALTTHQLQVERRESHRSQSSVMRSSTHQLQVWERGESHRVNQVYALTTHQLQVERERVIEPIKCMRSPHTSYRWQERESPRANQVVCAHHTPATGGEERES